MRKRKVVALVGLSGVGKSTLLGQARNVITFQHLQASELIKAERRHQQEARLAHDDLRATNINENQSLLVSGFVRLAPKSGLIVVDGHTVIDTPTGLVEIPPSVFAAMDVSGFIAVVDDIANIASKRALDKTRSRPNRSHEDLSEHQRRSILAAYEAALALSVPLSVVPLNGRFDITKYLQL